MELQRLSLTIHGRVQGVAFRYNTVQEARRLALAGWVRNDPTGCVSLEAQGTRSQLEELLAWCHHGPPGARVERVETRWLGAASEAPQGFHVLR